MKRISAALGFLLLLPSLVLGTVYEPANLKTPTNLYGSFSEGGEGVDDSTNAILEENFENASGYDDGTWIETSTPDSEYATSPAPLRGTYSLQINGDDRVEHSLASNTELWGHFRLNINGSTNSSFYYIRDSANTSLFQISVRTGGALRIFLGGVASGDSSTTLTAGNTYHIWWHWKSNEEAHLYIGTTTTRPASPELTITNTSGSGNSDDIYLAGNWSFASIMDQVLVKTADFSEVEE